MYSQIFDFLYRSLTAEWGKKVRFYSNLSFVRHDSLLHNASNAKRGQYNNIFNFTVNFISFASQ